jgi:threonyl-tRNA synthetase
MYYVDKDGQKKLPYIIHRTSLGCYERTLAYMIEHFNGVMPLWLAPEQVRLLPIGASHVEYAQKLAEKMTARGMRVTVDTDDINIGTKIKKSRLDRIPYMFIIGDKEVETGTLSVRSRKTGEESGVAADDMLARLYEEIDTKAK